MRVLGRVRLSRFNEESTSVERQREIIENWAQQNGHEVIGFAEDIDVSRSVDPFETPGLGQWLNDKTKIDQWDIVATWKLDRLATGSIYLNKTMGWCFEHEKVIVSVTENFDLSTWVGRMIANVIAGVAEGELEAIKERTQASRKKLVSIGRWTGGRPTFGYRKVEIESGGYALEPDPESSKTLHWIVDEVLNGRSAKSLVDDMNERGVYTPADFVRYRNGKETKGAKWSVTTLLSLLRSRTLLGHIMHNGQVVLDGVGEPVLAGPPLIDVDTFNRVQATLEARSRAQKVERTDASPLLGVLVCAECGDNMYHQRQVDKRYDRLYRYYKCLNRCGQQIHAEMAEQMVENQFLDDLGDAEALTRVYIPAENHQIELEEAQRLLDGLYPLLGTVTSAHAQKRLTEQISALDSKIAQLEMLPESPARTELRPTGVTYRKLWESLDSDGRRELMVKAGIQARMKVADRPQGARATGQTGAVTFHFHIPEDLHERIAS
ncbi:phage integrase [Rhodococcus phage RGL3]|uniref:Phage integrase n=1 Tax=Rhodococcus phage RGL3 TaxID=2922221 RepID=G9FHL4_9CAUD|nr:integrase [Rhodococcus phage RGL3]AEV52102.1 phage integrase [Rhodococcus phage RGL3]